jgi:hypothetical protein
MKRGLLRLGLRLAERGVPDRPWSRRRSLWIDRLRVALERPR